MSANTQMIALDKLTISQENVRRTKPTAIDALAESIKAEGLLQNLVVVAGANGRFAVTAGGRRLRALQALVARGDMPADEPVPCRVIDAAGQAAASLAENVQREAMHPLDEFAAFKALVDQGYSVDRIAAEHGASTRYVQQRLRLASVSPKIAEAYRDGQVALDVVMALAGTADQQQQEKLWEQLPNWNHFQHADMVKRMLCKEDIESTNPLAVFVGLEEYEKRGGRVREDLFSKPDDPKSLIDTELLTTLVREKLEKSAKRLAKEGWGWIECVPSVHHYLPDGLTEMPVQRRKMTDAEQAEVTRLRGEIQEVNATVSGSERWQKQDELSAQIEKILEGTIIDDKDLRAHAGALLAVDHKGKCKIMRGAVRAADKGHFWKGSGTSADPADADNAAPAISAKLASTLSAERTMAIRAELAEAPGLALATLVHAAAARSFYDYKRGCLDVLFQDEARVRSIDPEIAETSNAAQALQASKKKVRAMLPKKFSGLWSWVMQAKQDELMQVLAVATAETVNAVRATADAKVTPSGCNLGVADQLAGALDLHLRKWWKPTKANYFGRIKRKQIEADVAEFASDEGQQLVREAKTKTSAAQAAETLAAGIQWVPAPLR